MSNGISREYKGCVIAKRLLTVIDVFIGLDSRSAFNEGLVKHLLKLLYSII